MVGRQGHFLQGRQRGSQERTGIGVVLKCRGDGKRKRRLDKRLLWTPARAPMDQSLPSLPALPPSLPSRAAPSGSNACTSPPLASPRPPSRSRPPPQTTTVVQQARERSTEHTPLLPPLLRLEGSAATAWRPPADGWGRGLSGARPGKRKETWRGESSVRLRFKLCGAS